MSLLFCACRRNPRGGYSGHNRRGLSGTFTSIRGIVIIFGALVGTLLEKTARALKLADSVVKVVGKKNPELAIMLMGWIVSNRYSVTAGLSS